MSTAYVAFLRAINLGATRRLPMGEVKEVLAAAGYDDLATHLATGNVRLTDPAERGAAAVRDDVARLLSDHTGFPVPVVLCSLAELGTVRDEVRALNDGPAGGADKRYVAFLAQPPGDDARRELSDWSGSHPGEGAHVGARHLHWWTDGPTTEAETFKPATLRRLGIPEATSRTVAVIDTLVAKWC